MRAQPVRARPIDPAVQSLLDEAYRLPDCAARHVLLERAASTAESLEDLDSAWNARCGILQGISAARTPKFETLFLNMAWCLGLSDRDPDHFSPDRVLWQYKWLVEEAPRYASIPRPVLEKLIDDMQERFDRAGWGRRAALHKRMNLWLELGELERALSLLDEWRATRRDRGADCHACEVSFIVSLLAAAGRDAEAIREARPIIQGRLSCASVPHVTFCELLLPLTRAAKHEQARELYEKGRRLVAAVEEGGAQLAAPYIAFAAFIGESEAASQMLRTRFGQAALIPSDGQRLWWFGHASAALKFLHRRGIERIDLPRIAGLIEVSEPETSSLARQFHTIASHHAEALDRRNGNTRNAAWLNSLIARWDKLT